MPFQAWPWRSVPLDASQLNGLHFLGLMPRTVLFLIRIFSLCWLPLFLAWPWRSVLLDSSQQNEIHHPVQMWRTAL